MTIDVLGLGESIKRYKPTGNLTIGVNDISKFHEVDFLVCVDKINAFDEDRFKQIISSNCKKFFSHIKDWEYCFGDRFELIPNLVPINDYVNIKHEVSHSICSPFVAITVAIRYFNATTINMYGVDLNNHRHLSNELKQKRILKDFSLLNRKCAERGISLKVTKESILSKICESF